MKVDPGNGVNFLIMRTFHVLIVVFLLGACARRQPVPETVRPVKVTTAAGAAVIDKDFAGLATPDDAVNLAFKLPGQVLDVPVAQGESVKKGALLAELDPRDIELQVSADRSAFEEARSQMQRMQRLLEHEAVSRQEFESAQTRYAQVKSAYENSLGLLKETKLRAPFASVVERKFVDNYERVQLSLIHNLRAHETVLDLVCRLLLEKKKKQKKKKKDKIHSYQNTYNNITKHRTNYI